jgi:site-specific recombinase XerD
MAIRRAQIVSRFLDWLAAGGFITSNPFSELRDACRRHSTAAVVRALLSPDPDRALQLLRGLPRFGSHLGPAIRQHVERMQTLGLRYGEARFRRFDEFLQKRSGADEEPFASLVQEYAALATTAAEHLERVKVGRSIAKSLQRVNPTAPLVRRDRMVAREAARQRRKPYIFTEDEIRMLLVGAREFPSPKAPLRPIALYTMFVLAYCAGLRMGEIIGLQLRDLSADSASIVVRDTKFFKSRQLPLSPSATAALQGYQRARREAGASLEPDSALFWHDKGGYGYTTANHLMRRVMRYVGLKVEPGRRGPRIHDVRHTFVAHRMMAWYAQGIDVQAKLPYLWTYLGHRDLSSTLIYMTITQERLQAANERFRAYGARFLRSTETSV